MKLTIESKYKFWMIDFLLGETPIAKNVERAINQFNCQYGNAEGNKVVVEDRENRITVTVEKSEGE